VASLFSLGKARHTVHRWLLGEEEKKLHTADDVSTEKALPSQQESQDQSIFRFIEELKASQQEWLGRVRMIRFDSIQERMGSAWVKLRDRVEILAERIIREEISGHDRYMKAGNAEFLVFFADATPEESRIRCLAIVEAIHEKLFGLDKSKNQSSRRIAECHVAHRDDFELEWEASSHSGEEPGQQPAAEVLRSVFQGDGESLEGADIVASAQIVIDSIISRGAESETLNQLTPLLERLRSLSRSLRTLEPALAAAGSAGCEAEHGTDADVELVDDGRTLGDVSVKPLGRTWDDIAELTSVLDVGIDRSHADLLIELGRLRRSRLARANAFADDERAPQLERRETDFRQFEYVPVYRSVSRGERIHQGIYRVICRSGDGSNTSTEGESACLGGSEAIETERATLEHAIQYLLDRRMNCRCMLMVSVHGDTLRKPISQRRYSSVLRSAQLRAKRRLLIEIIDYSDADNTIGMRRAVEELRVHSNAVFVKLSPKALGNVEKLVAECKRLGVHAFGVDASQFHGRELDSVSMLVRTSSLAERHSIQLYIDGIGSVSVLAKAIARGASYVCAPTLRPAQATPGDADLATLDDLYSAI